MKVLILGAARQVAKRVTDIVLKHTDASVVLYAREVSKRLHPKDKARGQVIEGNFENLTRLEKAMDSFDWVFIDSGVPKMTINSLIAQNYI